MKLMTKKSPKKSSRKKADGSVLRWTKSTEMDEQNTIYYNATHKASRTDFCLAFIKEDNKWWVETIAWPIDADEPIFEKKIKLGQADERWIMDNLEGFKFNLMMRVIWVMEDRVKSLRKASSTV